MSVALSSILHGGLHDFRDFINPLIYSRAELACEPTRLVRAEGGALIDDQGRRVEDFHGTQAFGHRHPVITTAVREFQFDERANPGKV